MMLCFFFLRNEFHREVLINYKILFQYHFNTRWSVSEIWYILVTDKLIHIDNSGEANFLRKSYFLDIDSCLIIFIVILETMMKSCTLVISTSFPGQYLQLNFYSNLVKFLDKFFTCEKVINVNNIGKSDTLQNSLFHILTVL